MNSKLSLIGKTTAILSFIIGTVLFLIYLNNKDAGLIIQIGFVFIISAIIINSILLIIILFYAFKSYPYNYQLLNTAAIMLINIPITSIYIYVLFEILLGY